MDQSSQSQAQQQLLVRQQEQQQQQQQQQTFQQQKPTHLHLLQPSQTQVPASSQQDFLEPPHIAQEQNGSHYQQSQPQHQNMYGHAVAISSLPPATTPPVLRYSPYAAGQPPHAPQSSYTLDQLAGWPARTNIANSALILDQSVLSQNLAYQQQQTLRYGLQGSPYQILTPPQPAPLNQPMLEPAGYDYMQQLKVEPSGLQHRALPSTYSSLSMPEHPRPQSGAASASAPLQQSPAQDQPRQSFAYRYSLPASGPSYLAEVPSPAYTATQLQADPLANPMMAHTLSMRRRAGSTPNIHPSKMTAKPQQGTPRTAASGAAFVMAPGLPGAQALSLQSVPATPASASSLAYSVQVARIGSAVSSMALSPNQPTPCHMPSSGLAPSAVPQSLGLHTPTPTQGMQQDDFRSLQGAQLDATALAYYQSDPTPHFLKRDEQAMNANGDDGDLWWKIPRGVTNIEQIIEQWERGDGPQCPALCDWTVGMRRRERSIFSQRKKLYEEYLRLGSVEAFNSKYKDLPIGRVYAIVSSRNRKQRRENNLAGAAPTEQDEAV